jgi:hypothetical protein
MNRGVQPYTPAAVRKLLFEVDASRGGKVVHPAFGIECSRRKQLFDQRVPFIMPQNQVFLPMLGINLREHRGKVREATE